MLHKKISYTDYNNEPQVEEFWFNLTETEILEMELSNRGGYKAMIEDMINTKDYKSLFDLMTVFVLNSVGKKSADGRRFVKNDQIRDDFKYSPAYTVLVKELITDQDKAAAFINGVIPNNPDNKTADPQ